MTIRIYFEPGLKPVIKHGTHDQKTHGNWASGSVASELSDDEIKDIFYSAKTVEEAYTTIASRLGKSMKPQVADLAEDEVNLYRGVTNVERDVKRLLDGKIKYTEFQTWGQGIYADPTKSRAADYGTVVGLKLSDDAKILKGEMEWDKAVPVTWENDRARVRGTVTSDFVDMSRIKMNPNESGQPNYSISDLKNLYWAAKGYDGFSPHGGEMVLFNGGVLTVDSKSMKTAVQKHGTHDQKTHGNWAKGITEEMSKWDPEDTVPNSPKNKGSVPARAWENWEHGPDGRQFVDLYRQYAGEALGLDVPKSELDVGGSENYLTQRGFGGSSTDTARKHALAMLDAIEKGLPQPALYRGLTPVSNEEGKALISEFRNLKEGDTIDLPLTSTTRSLGVATWYGANRVGGSENAEPPVIIKIQEGAKGISRSAEGSYYPSDYEVITSGKFEVVGSSTIKMPYWEREMVAMRPGSNPERGDYITGWGSKRVDEYRDSAGEIKRDAYDGLFEGVKSGNWGKMRTDTVRYTNDRGGQMLSPNFKYGDEIRLNRWDLVDTAKEFFVVELRMVESHKVEKASDLGAKFHIIFGGRLGDEKGEEPFEKHGTHDQKTHGNWATGGTVVTSLVDKLSETKTPGFSIDIRTKTSPKDGYIASDAGAERPLDWAKVSATRDTLRSEIKKYIVDHAELLDGSGAFFGAWVDEGTLYLDVSRRYASRSEGVRAGFKNEQKAIYDVVNDSYIYMKDEVDDRAEKARDGRDTETSQGDDRGGTGRLRGRDSRGDTGQSLNRHVCLGRYTIVQKHLEGQHDQRTHGNWAGDRYPEDSVKSARDGALEYSYKKGLKHDETIDYKKVVANRERASQIADVYEDLPKFDNDAVDEYEALASEVEEQFDFMTKTLGVKVEFVADDPYKTSKEMFEDVSKGSLKVLQTETTGAHPLFSDEQNNKFRAVHDFFGHAATGRGFGQDGEEAAWVHHSQMFTEKARGALTTETRGQNSFFNNRGKQFADQKVALLPEQYWKVPATFSKRFEIYFEPGLKPTIKHLEGQHDQMTHGRWATAGYTAEESERISAMEGVGPTLQDMSNALNGGEEASGEQLLTLVMNDRNLYEQMRDEMDVEGKVRLEEADFKYMNGREPTEQEKVSIYEKVENEAAEGFVEYNRTDLNRQFNIENGTFSEVSELEESFRGVFDITKETDFGTMKSRISDVYQEDENTIKVEGNITIDDDMTIGQFERVFMKNDDGTFSVEHKWLSIEDEYQGQGFGGKFIRQSEDYYTAIGIRDIFVTAGLEDGARHWARAGFDWDASMVSDAFRKLANRVENDDSIAFTEQDRTEFDALWSRGATSIEFKPDYPRGIQMKDIKSPDFPFPAEFASLGWDRRGVDDKGDWDWAGKRLMEGLVIDYRKPITAEGRNLLGGPIDRDGDGLVYDGTARERPVSNN